jgi:hypothetical protein
MDYTELEPHQEVYRTGIIYDLKSLFAFLLRVSDPRHARGKQYPLELLLVLILLAKICGENTPTGIALCYLPDRCTGGDETLAQAQSS